MVHPVSYDYNATAQIAAAHLLPNLRLFQVGRQWSNNGTLANSLALGCAGNGTSPPLSPGCAVRNVWRKALAAAATFSAVCYSTAQELMRGELGTGAAVGLVEVDWGGSNQHTWQTHAFAKGYGCDVFDMPDAPCPLENKTMSPKRGDNYGCLYHGMIEPMAASLRPALALWYQVRAPRWGAAPRAPLPACSCRAVSCVHMADVPAHFVCVRPTFAAVPPNPHPPSPRTHPSLSLPPSTTRCRPPNYLAPPLALGRGQCRRPVGHVPMPTRGNGRRVARDLPPPTPAVLCRAARPVRPPLPAPVHVAPSSSMEKTHCSGETGRAWARARVRAMHVHTTDMPRMDSRMIMRGRRLQGIAQGH